MSTAILSFPSVFTVLPMLSATELTVEAFVSDGHVFVRIHLVGETENFIRLPERRHCVAHKQLQAEHLNEVAQQLSLPNFRRYIADCGFVRQ